MHKKIATFGVICAMAVLAGCAPQVRHTGDYSLEREAIAGTHKPVPPPSDIGGANANQTLSTAPAAGQQYGSGVFINGAAARGVGGATRAKGTLVFNFDNQPVQAAVKAILGDVLGANYAISPDVKGTVTFSTSRPVAREDVLPILEMLLSWTDNALIRQGQRYLVVPVDQAALGTVVPGLTASSPSAGYAARLFPLSYVSAEAMQKLLQPFADDKAFLLVDPLRNLLVMGGTPDELANYQRIIRTFDVDWLRGMSVAVIPLQHVRAEDLVSQLEQLFTEQSDGKGKQMSSLVRLIPLKHSNSLVIITPQPVYIGEVRKLVTTIDNGAGNSSGLYVYNVLNVKASDLARHLNALFGNNGSGGQSQAGAVAPGFSALEQTSGMGAQQGFGGFSPDTSMGGGDGSDAFGGGSGGGVGAGMVSGATQSRRQQQMANDAFAFTTSEGVRIAAVNENNQLLIRAKPGQWEKLLPVIERLDEKPLQVQIETRVLEVTLQGEFKFGVQYYLQGLIGTQKGSPPNTDQSFRRHQGAAGLGGVAYDSASALFYSFAGSNLQFALQALETNGDTKVLSAPSTVVLNNQETTFKVGQKIPVVQTFYTPGLPSNGASNAGQVQYIDTGVLLDVVPRVSPGGLVYLDVQQIVSNPTIQDKFGNYTIANRSLSTEVAVQNGQTVLLGGLIQQTDSNQDNGVPFLNRIPVLGRLFGTTDRKKTRSELIVLITPRIIRNPEDARRVTDQYETQFESLRPILPPGAGAPLGAQGVVPIAPSAAPPSGAVVQPLGNDTSTSVAPAGAWSVQVASFADNAAAEGLRTRLQQLGYASYVDSASTPSGTAWRVRAGPVVSRSAAQQLLTAIAGSLHIGGMQVTHR